MTWYLWAVFVQQRHATPFVKWTTLAVAVYTSIWVGKCVVGVGLRIRRGRQAILLDEEREPFAEEDS